MNTKILNLKFRTMPVCVLFLMALSSALTLSGRDIYVNNLTGSDSNPGDSIEKPLKSIVKAINIVKAGDNIRIVNTGKDYLQFIPFSNRTGTAKAPITVYGNNVVLNGSDKLNPKNWKMVAPGLYKNDTIYTKHRFNKDIIARYFFVINGKLNSMGRCMKGKSAPLKKKEDLKNKEWTFVASEKAFYMKIDPAKKLADCDIRVPIRMNGVSIHHKADYIIIRDITAKNFVNDGYGLSGSGRNNKLINIASIDCGDDGISAHAESGATIDGFYSSGNGTGICDTGDSCTVYNNVVIENIRGVSLYFLQERKGKAYHKMINTIVKSGGFKQFIITTSRPTAYQKVIFDNLIFIGKKSGDAYIRLYGNVDVEFKNSTILNMNWVAYMNKLSISNSLLTDRKHGINCKKGAIFSSNNNIFGIRHLRFDKSYYSGRTPALLAKYREVSGDKSSEFMKASDVNTIGIKRNGKLCGANISLFNNEKLKEKAKKISL